MPLWSSLSRSTNPLSFDYRPRNEVATEHWLVEKELPLTAWGKSACVRVSLQNTENPDRGRECYTGLYRTLDRDHRLQVVTGRVSSLITHALASTSHCIQTEDMQMTPLVAKPMPVPALCQSPPDQSPSIPGSQSLSGDNEIGISPPEQVRGIYGSSLVSHASLVSFGLSSSVWSYKSLGGRGYISG